MSRGYGLDNRSQTVCVKGLTSSLWHYWEKVDPVGIANWGIYVMGGLAHERNIGTLSFFSLLLPCYEGSSLLYP